MKVKKIRTTFFLLPKHRELLKLAAEVQGDSQAGVIIDLIVKHINQHTGEYKS